MDGLSVAASVIAVVDVSVKILTLCSQYSKAVANAGADITRLATLIKGLRTTLDHAKALIEAPQGASLSTSHHLQEQLEGCLSTLQELDKKLELGIARSSKRRFWVRALKWPFSHGEMEALVSLLERYHGRIMDGLQVDQTTLLLHIKDGVDNFLALTDEDISVAKKPHFLVPFPQDPDFVPRPAIQAQISEQLAGQASRLALFGMGGFGKSLLAIQLAHDVHRSNPEKSVFWLRGNSQATFEASYRSLADILALPRRHDPKTNILALVCDWLQREDVAPWLIILDNADDFDIFFGSVEESPIASYLPKTSNGKILVTSRNLNVAEKLIGDQKAIIQLPAMRSEEALILLQEKLISSDDEAAAADLVRCLDFIPLAVNQAAAYINRRRISVNAYIQRFQENDRQRASLLRYDGGNIRRQESVSNSVAITWQVTFDQVRRERPTAANLLSLLSCFQPQNIPQYMLSGYSKVLENSDVRESACDINTLEDDIDTLFCYSLISTPTGPQLYEMHSLVQVCTRAWLSEQDYVTSWEKLFLRLASEHFPRGHFETWRKCQLLLPHFERMLEKQPDAEADILGWGVLLTNVSYYMIEKGNYNKAIDFAQKSVDVRKRLLGADHPSTLTSMNNLASTYGEQGRWEEAEKLHMQVMETRKTKRGVDHPSTLTSMNNLASIYRNQGRWEEAEKLYTQVIEMGKIKLGADYPDTLIYMGNLAVTYGDQGRWEEAEKLHVQVLETSKTKLGVDHPDTLITIDSLALTHSEQGRWEEAEKLHIYVIETRKTMLGVDHPDTLTSMNNLASTYRDQGRLEEAEKLQVQVMETSKTKLGADHPDTLASMNNLASIYWEQGRREEALDLMDCCASLRERVLGSQHPHTKSSKNTINLWR